MKSFFIDVFEYNNEANQKLIVLIELILIGHTINAHSICNHRIDGTL
jgi:hypothetical protein